MKKVAIYGQSYAVSAVKEIQTLLAILASHNIEVLFERTFYDLHKTNNTFDNSYTTFTDYKDLSTDIDVLITIGGDGTILRAVTYIRDLGIPILGINAGRLGFLATVQKDEIKEAVTLLLHKKYTLQERSLLEITTSPRIKEFETLNFALNEITVARRNTTSMIGVKTYLNDELLTNYWSDGLIVSTPTGSTGYSLSCNGPVILPNSESFVITPIAPHNLNARPMIINDQTKIDLEVSSREQDFLISLDSRINTVPLSTKVSIQKADFTIKTVVLKDQSYLKTLRSKLLWGEDNRNK